jgi:hypothetical protein
MFAVRQARLPASFLARLVERLEGSLLGVFEFRQIKQLACRKKIAKLIFLWYGASLHR